ncbi:MAG TPA: porin [Methylophilaceae bacterium]|jgi:hypothetical protein
MNKKLLGLALVMVMISGNAMATSIEDKIDILQQEIEELKAQAAASEAKNHASGIKGLQGFVDNTTIGGYGEIVYNNFKGSRSKNGEALNDTTDVRRAVLYIGHRFTDRLTFHSELEVEHAVSSADDQGEFEVEQAYLDYKFNDVASVKAGLFLMPLGLLNENHEPPRFFGVNRNEVETRIIPTTYREVGIGLFGGFENGFGYDVGITTGFDSGKIDEPALGVRSGHQEGQLAHSEDLQLYASAKYTGIPGLLLGAGFTTGNTGQDGASSAVLKNVDARLTLGEVHARYETHGFDLSALYARGKLNDARKVTQAIGNAAPDDYYGWYMQVAYHAYKTSEIDIAPFIRFERFDVGQQENAADGSFFPRDVTARDRITTVGVNIYPHPDVVVKADYQHYQNDDAHSSFNLGLGYQF